MTTATDFDVRARTDGVGASAQVEYESGVRALYVRSDPDDVFVQLHAPTGMRRSSTAVLVVPPFGWHEMCTSRVRRTWAQALADDGHFTVRLDLPGTGDSAGNPRDPDRVGAWTRAVADVARWLRDAYNAERIVALGFGLGGMLAWRACTLGAPIDDLALWAVPPRGRRLLRELEGAAALNIDAEIRDETVTGKRRRRRDRRAENAGRRATDVSPRSEDEPLLEEGGQILTAETCEQLESLNLAALMLPRASSRRILLLERPASKGDANLRAIVEATGAAVTVADGKGYDQMLASAQLAETPFGAIGRSLQWLRSSEGQRARQTTAADDLPAPGAIAAKPGGPVALEPLALEALETPDAAELATLELVGPDGRRIRERPVELRVREGMLRGIVCEPAERSSADLCAVLLNGGSDRRIGPNRMWVETARRWAARGVTSLRIDPVGVGDSDGQEVGIDQLAHYHPVNVPRSIELLEAVGRLDVPQRLVLVGFCSGAHRALHLALRDPRVVGLFTISLPFFFKSRWSVGLRDMWLVDLSARADDPPRKARMRRLLRQSRLLELLHLLVGTLRRSVPDRTDHLLASLAARETETLFLFKAGSKEHAELVAHRRLPSMRAMPRVTVRRLPSDDVRLRPLAVQRLVGAELDAALGRLLERNR